MKTYKIKVREIHYYERDYYIHADNAAEAKQLARDGEYWDADQGEWQWAGRKNKILKTETIK